MVDIFRAVLPDVFGNGLEAYADTYDLACARLYACWRKRIKKMRGEDLRVTWMDEIEHFQGYVVRISEVGAIPAGAMDVGQKLPLR